MTYVMSQRISWHDFASQYLLGNFLSAIASVATAVIVSAVTHSAVITAISATIAGDIAWYFYIWVFNLVHGDTALIALRHLIGDFGVAEALDSLLIRPVLFYLLPKLTHSQASGVLIATVLADVIYTAIGLNRQRKREASSKVTVSN